MVSLVQSIKINNSNHKPMSIVCEIDPQEVLFDQMVKLWVDGEISYDMLMNNFPTYYSSMIRRILTTLRNMFL